MSEQHAGYAMEGTPGDATEIEPRADVRVRLIPIPEQRRGRISATSGESSDADVSPSPVVPTAGSLSATAGQRGLIHFRPRARLIRLLGEELISSEVMALVELVKNAYDADAHRVTVRLRNSEAADTTIEVVDDGEGMSLDRVLHSWMEPATSHKRQAGRKRRTALGRIPLGEKGVGRFAADKLGAEMDMVTRARGADQEVVLRVAWQHFEDDTYLEDIKSQWAVRLPEEVLDPPHGTLIRMRQVRATWDEQLVARVRDGLARLMPAHGSAGEFAIVLDCPEYPDFDGPVANRLLDNAPHVLRGSVDGEGVLTVADGQVRDLRQGDPSRFVSEGSWRTPVCGPFSLALRVWDLDAGGATPSTIDRTTRAQLRASSGVSIYRDGFRVMPYGERGNDWLELNQRRVNNPTMRVSNNQIVGVVEITQESNPDLRDRTSREGLVETPGYFDLVSLVVSALAILEERRFTMRHPEASQPRPEGRRDEMLDLIESARARAQEGTGMLLALQAVERTYQQRVDDNQRRYEHLLRLAGIGLAAERMTEEFAQTLNSARLIIRTALNQGRALGVTAELQQQLDSLSEHYELLDEQLDLMSPLYRSSMRLLEPIDLCGAAHDVTRILSHNLRTADVQVRIRQESPLSVRINRGHLLQVLLILFDNATQSLCQRVGDGGPEIHVQVGVVDGAPSLIVADNGPGIQPELLEAIFSPQFAARAGGRGLGLHVARDILADYGAVLKVLAQDTILPGANFLIRFDARRRSN